MFDCGLSSDARRSSLRRAGEPQVGLERRERKTRRLFCVVLAAMFSAVASFWLGRSVQRERVRRRRPTRRRACRRWSACRPAGTRRRLAEPGSGQSAYVAQLSLVFSMSTRGSLHDPVLDAEQPVVEPVVQLAHPLRAVGHERVDVPLAAQPQLARDVVARQRVHHSVVWSGSTLSSCRQCVAKTEALTLPASGR